MTPMAASGTVLNPRAASSASRVVLPLCGPPVSAIYNGGTLGWGGTRATMLAQAGPAGVGSR